MLKADREIYAAFADYGYVGQARASVAVIWAIRLVSVGAVAWVLYG